MKGMALGMLLILLSTCAIPSEATTSSSEKLTTDRTLLSVERIYATAGVINVELKNIGTVDAIDVVWVLGYARIRFLPPALTYVDTDGYIPQLAANETVTIKTNQGSNPTTLFGFSPLVIKVISYAYNAPLVSNTTNAFLLLIFIKI
jgi:hypothetical protein